MCACVCIMHVVLFVVDECVSGLCRSSSGLDQIYFSFMQTGNGMGCPHDLTARH